MTSAANGNGLLGAEKNLQAYQHYQDTLISEEVVIPYAGDPHWDKFGEQYEAYDLALGNPGGHTGQSFTMTENIISNADENFGAVDNNETDKSADMVSNENPMIIII